MSAAASPDGGPRRLALAGPALAAAAAAAFAGFASLQPRATGGGSVSVAWEWAPSLGVGLAFRVDGLSLLFALLVTGFGALISVHAARYLRDHPHNGRFFLYLALFMLGMLGLTTADDVIALFVFWEVTTAASFLLVGFSHAGEKARRAAWQALLVTGAGGLALLAGLLLLADAAGSVRLSEIVATPGLKEHPAYPAILALVIAGCFAKSAQFPLHFWLPNAMAAPTPVSAYLHSATMVKAGIYLLARLHPALSGTDGWQITLGAAGGITMLGAAFLAMRQTDLKLALAYTTLMALGSLVMFLGAEAPIAVAAAMTFIVVHALYKAALFLSVGCIEWATGTRELDKLGGLWRIAPFTALATALAAGSMAGFPPFLGFIGKELKYEGALAIAEEPFLLAGAAVLSNALMVALALTILLRVVLGRPKQAPQAVRRVPVAMWIPPLAFACGGLALGVAPDLIGATLVQPAVTAVVGAPQVVQLKLWHGLNVPLAMSIATTVLGVVGFFAHRRMGALVRLVPQVADRAWDGLLAGFARAAGAFTAVVQPGSLRTYLTVALSVVFGAPLIALVAAGWTPPAPGAWGPDDAEAAAAALLAAAGAAGAALARERIGAATGLGASGAGVALLFVLHAAPDVAITQLMVDVILTLMLLGAFALLPRLAPRAFDGRAAALGLLAGVSVAALTLAAGSADPSKDAATAMTALSLPEAKGRNIVNVILVDFRALDTFGEIAVVAAAAIGAVALLGLIRGRKAEGAR
jgi:multicomponent Na+:H+ antiporter subunit A